MTGDTGSARALASVSTGEGVVVEFHEPRGIGVIETSGGVRYPFHCTQIADGTRTIAVGTVVRFVVVAGHLGRWEAAAIEPR